MNFFSFFNPISRGEAVVPPLGAAEPNDLLLFPLQVLLITLMIPLV
jgi:hypothetical protein